MIVFISGSYPYAPDGISDGARILYEAMKNNSKNEEFVLVTTNRDDIRKYLIEHNYSNVILVDDWKIKLRNIRTVLKAIPNASIVHMEYPGTYYGKTFLPSFIPLLLKLRNLSRNRKDRVLVSIRLHEYSDARLLRKLAIVPIAFFSDCIYIPALVDRQQLGHIVLKKKIRPTMIGSNIPTAVYTPPIRTGNVYRVSYFGAAYPGKGIEKMLLVWKKMKDINSTLNISFHFIGDVGVEEGNKFQEYHKRIIDMVHELGLKDDIIFTGYLEDTEVSKELSKTTVATLFFDDGLTLRRGSFLACLSHGIPIVTSEGDLEAKELFGRAKGVYMSDDVDCCAKKAIDYLLLSEEIRKEIQVDNRKLSETFSWNTIANSFLNDYQELRRRHKQ